MGGEIGQEHEWNHCEQLPWDLLDDPQHDGIRRFVGDLNRLYVSEPALHECDHVPGGIRVGSMRRREEQRLCFHSV